MSDHVHELKWAIGRQVLALVAFNALVLIVACVAGSTAWPLAIALLIATGGVAATAVHFMSRAIDYNREEQQRSLRVLREQVDYWKARRSEAVEVEG